ncbi:class V lanthionine synthetase subunit LxmK [Micromonospora sp. CPCC 206060]|uniref:class V lanthionine synthetase subunit LxmK n=1 Tax=Micromonospora sp. CPCC 206060 TaxID=3122406 RepID=UPI002FF1DB08
MLAKVEPRPLSLSDFPEVNAFLTELGLGELDPDTVRACTGRNTNWSGHTSTGAAVFVKRLDGDLADAHRRYDRLLDLDGRDTEAADWLRFPALLGADRDRRLVVFEWLAEARPGSELAADDLFDGDLCRRAGRMVGELHRSADALDRSPYPLPPTSVLRAMPLAVFHQSRGPELRFWRILQQDDQLVAALNQLREAERTSAPRRPCHCDLRFDQFLRDGDLLYLLDGEEFRMADPARDVGAFAGEWLHTAIRRVNADLGEQVRLTHEEVVARGTAEIGRVRPLVTSFWTGYLDSGVPIDPTLAERATAYAGWHLLDRLLAAAGARTRLRAVDLAAAGVGRTALLSPASFIGTLGLVA